MGKGGKKERRRRQAVEEAELQQQNSGTKEVVTRSKAEKVQAKRKKVDASADVAPAPGKRSRDLQLAAGKDSPRRKRTKVDKDPCSDSKDSSNKTVLTSLETDQHNECPSETSDCGQNENAPEEVAVVTPREVRRVGRRSSAGTSSAKTAAAAADLIKSPMAMAKYVAEQVGSDSEVNADEPVQYAKFVGSPFSKAKAKARWPHRYETKDKVLNDASNRLNREAAADDRVDVDCVAHYSKALVDGMLFELDDTVEINNEGGKNFIGKVVEMFEKRDGSPWITAQWFFYVEDTALGEDGKDSGRHDPKRLFFSDVQDANPLDCLVKKVSVTRVPTVQLDKDVSLEQSDFVYDMGYTTAYSAFYSLPAVGSGTPSSQKSSEVPSSEASESSQDKERSESSELSLLDLYAGCGAMSTGLCSGARLAGHNLISRWAVDINQEACESYKYNHPETEVRNEKADDFFALIKEWQQLCAKYPLGSTAESKPQEPKADDKEDSDDDSEELSDEVFEVQKLLAVKYEEPQGLLFKVRWKGYSEDEDTWEPLANLEDCPERLEEFVVEGRRNNLLPLPGKVDVICGGPPCQGASGFNRFRNYTNPLADPRNHQMVVYMDIVDFLKPRFILMENVVDILKFCGGVLGKYALSRLVSMHYQAKIGLLVAGSYGLPQFRMRVFLWGASTTEKLPAFPLPTHDVVKRGHPPVHWEQNLVSLDEDEKHRLEKALVLQDAISDLPPISNYEKRDERAYDKPPQTPFQRLVRMQKPGKPVLYDHKSLIMNKDDYDRACQIPKRKGANFRDLEGVIVYDDKTVAVKQKNRKMLASGKPLVPDYAITFVGGKSCKPFGRLWWDETVSTVVTRAEPHNQAVLHPSQDRVLSIRENARLQGFPDHYKLFGDTKEKYKQVGNAVAVPVARALGYALGKAISDDVSGADFLLPQGFPMSLIDAEGPPSYSLDLPQTVTGADFQLPESMFASKELTLPQDVPGADFQLPESMFSAKDSDSS